MRQYHDLLRYVLENGSIRKDRTGTGTKGVFGYSMRFNLADGFPLLTTKKMFTKGIIHELLWFLSGNSNLIQLLSKGVHIWDNDAYRFYCERCEKLGIPQAASTKEEFIKIVEGDNILLSAPCGYLGKIYGYQWRHWQDSIDQISNVIELIKKDPYSRRMLVTAWNPAELDDMALPPCHVLFQFNVNDGKLNCQMYQRSGDIFLGVPFNIASYSLLLMMIAQVCDLQPGEFIHVLGDAHIYLNHIKQVEEQLSREPKSLPVMKLNPEIKDIFEFKYEDFTLEGYDPWPAIKGEMSY